MDVNNFWKVTKFTVVQQVKSKSFKISTAIILVAILILVSLVNFIPAFISKVENSKGSSKITNSIMDISIDKAYYINNSDLGIDVPLIIQNILPKIKWEKAIESKDELIKKLDKTKEAMVAVLITQNERGYNVDVVTPSDDTVVSKEEGYMLSQIIVSSIERERLLAQGLSSEQVEKLALPISGGAITAGDNLSDAADIIVRNVFPMVMCMLLFYIIYFYGYWVASSIVAEKTSRIMELLLTSTKPIELVVGKCVGMGFLAITQFASILFVAFISFVGSGVIIKEFISKEANIIDIGAIIGKISPLQWVLIILFFILGYALYAVLNALVGATVSKLEDLNTALMPVAFISLIGFYLSYMGVFSPEATIGKIVTYLPISSSFFIPSVILSDTISITSMIISLLILIVTIILLALFTARVYSVVILQTGNRVKIKDLFAIYKREK